MSGIVSHETFEADVSNIVTGLRFNQHVDTVACITSSHLRTFDLRKFGEYPRVNIQNFACVTMVEFIQDSAYIGLVCTANIVGGKLSPACTVHIYDYRNGRLYRSLTAPQPIRSIRLRKDMTFIITEQHIYVNDFPDCNQHKTLLTYPKNHMGLCEVTSRFCPKAFCVYPIHAGVIYITCLDNFFARDTAKGGLLKCHTTEIACLAISKDGSLIATASTQGTLIRVFESDTKNKLHILRRGMDPARILNLCFDDSNDYLCCSSDKLSVHIFRLISKVESSFKASIFKSLGSKKFEDALEGKKSMFKIPLDDRPTNHVIGMDSQKNLFIYSADGHYEIHKVGGTTANLIDAGSFLYSYTSDDDFMIMNPTASIPEQMPPAPLTRVS